MPKDSKTKQKSDAAKRQGAQAKQNTADSQNPPKKPNATKAQNTSETQSTAQTQKKSDTLKYIFAALTFGLVAAVTFVAFAKPNSFDSLNDPGTSQTATLNKNANVDDIVETPGKVNIYFFWGDGCPHCREEYEFFESINDEYGKFYNFYGFEVWHNDKNSDFLVEMTRALDQSTSGVPVTIIGKKVFVGFSAGRDEEIKKAIESQHDNAYDVYFDKIKYKNEGTED